MQIDIEYSIVIKDECEKLVVKEHSYDPVLLSKNNNILLEKVKSAYDKFKTCRDKEDNSAPEIVLNFKMKWQ